MLTWNSYLIEWPIFLYAKSYNLTSYPSKSLYNHQHQTLKDVLPQSQVLQILGDTIHAWILPSWVQHSKIFFALSFCTGHLISTTLEVFKISGKHKLRIQVV